MRKPKYGPIRSALTLLFLVTACTAVIPIDSAHASALPPSAMHAANACGQWAHPNQQAPDRGVEPEHRAIVYIFWGDGCPHCAKAKQFLAELVQRHHQIEVRDYEVYYVLENRTLFTQMAAALGFEPRAVPTIIVGRRYWEGYNDQVGEQIEAYVVECVASGCPDAGQGIVTSGQPSSAEPGDLDGAQNTPSSTAEKGEPTANTEAASEVINVPLLGNIDLASQSLTVSTALIAFVDGFNPCSLWVLSVLIALTLHTGSRKKVFVIGLVFITMTALVYVLFIAGLFTVFTFVSFVGWIQVVVALVALFFALVNIKDYFWYKEGISFTIADEKKPGLYKRMRGVMDAGESLWGLVTATVALAAGVSLVEFSCTAGFPVLWTNLLSAQDVTPSAFGALLILYMVIYQIDELAIFLAAVFTFRASKLEEKHGRILKLIGGTLMLTLAIVMTVDPALMNSLRNSLLIFGIAFVSAMVVLFVHRQILPYFNISIGSEIAPPHRPRGHRQIKRQKQAR